jgi:hypothetical protein
MITMIGTLMLAAFLLAAAMTHETDGTSAPSSPPAGSCAEFGCAS